MTHPEIAGEFAVYFDYILDLVGGGELWDEYEYQLKRLFDRKYYSENRINGNFIVRAEALRRHFVGEDDELWDVVPRGEVSVLEILVVLALRIDETVMFNQKYSDGRADMCFSEIFEAAGFDCSEDEIDMKIDDFLEGRTVLADDARPDQTLWAQANVLFLRRFEQENEEFPV